MSREVFQYGLWFLLFWLMQVLLFREIELRSGWLYVQWFIYPLFVLWLPVRTPGPVVILLSFLLGLLVDVFYHSPGVHASALTGMGFLRSFVLSQLEPREGYQVQGSPTAAQYGLGWFIRYSGILMFLHILFYNISDFFTLYYWKDILLHTLWSFGASMGLILIFSMIFSPRM